MDADRPTRLTRRGFLAGTVAAALAACSDGSEGGADTTPPPNTTGPPNVPPTTPPVTAPPSTIGATTTAPTTTVAPPVTSNPFTIGVASGDPLADSVILWTRLVPDDPMPDTDVELDWEVATDTAMDVIVASGTATAIAALGHSVHVDVTGLEPNTEYHYRFRLGDYETAPARTHTFAAPGTMPEQFRFAFSSCQN